VKLLPRRTSFNSAFCVILGHNRLQTFASFLRSTSLINLSIKLSYISKRLKNKMTIHSNLKNFITDLQSFIFGSRAIGLDLCNINTTVTIDKLCIATTFYVEAEAYKNKSNTKDNNNNNNNNNKNNDFYSAVTWRKAIARALTYATQ